VLIIKSIKQTCSAWPSQWEAKLNDGKMLYIRYRSGYLSVDISDKETDDVMDAVDNKEIYGDQIGDRLDGFLNMKQLINHTKHLIDYDNVGG
jgi:hypothetical protein